MGRRNPQRLESVKHEEAVAGLLRASQYESSPAEIKNKKVT